MKELLTKIQVNLSIQTRESDRPIEALEQIYHGYLPDTNTLN